MGRSIASRFVPNFEQTELSGQLMLSQNYAFLREMPGLYVIRNKIDPNRNRFKIGMGMNMIERINTYYTYFPEGLELWYACSVSKTQTRSMMELHERSMWEFIIQVAGRNNVYLQMNNDRTSGTEWLIVPSPEILFKGIALWVNDVRDQRLYVTSNKENVINNYIAEDKAPERKKERLTVEPSEEESFSRKQYNLEMKLMEAFARNTGSVEGMDDQPLSSPLGRARE